MVPPISFGLPISTNKSGVELLQAHDPLAMRLQRLLPHSLGEIN